MSVQSLDRAFDILELLSRERQGMMLTDIGKKLDLHKSTVFRLLSSLKERGYIEKNSDTGLYRLGLGFIALTSQYLNNLEIKTEAEPYLRRLSERLGETVFLATLRDGEVVYLDKVERYDGLRRYSIIGRRAPVHCTSLGKSLVMDLKQNEIRELFAQKTLKKVTPNTITDVDILLERLKEFNHRGWSKDVEEYESGVSCVGAPIKDYRGATIAAISSAWEGTREERDIIATGEALKATADEISRHLGFFSDQTGEVS
ncbi:MAG: IclR family transcriptional regulator [Spirochaetaceae bacterium]|nr:IclR family transcriptional regulator [Spirochaetaceae bacterium]MDT8297357.1 IclR family transcriptional regulator [Spirochaetaceae bacterium]